MGCFSSKPDDASVLIRRRPASIGEVAVFVPGLRVPEPLELPPPLADSLPRRLTERLAASRDRIANMAAREALAVTKPRRRAATQHGASTSADLVQALEEYLPVILGMAKDGSELEDKIQFAWMNQEDDAEGDGTAQRLVRGAVGAAHDGHAPSIPGKLPAPAKDVSRGIPHQSIRREQTRISRGVPQGGRAPGVCHAPSSSQDVA
uniref:Uncharacterized protein n=1 Tax=Aegilops tauschii subsp. strangulata TaxID=200361 RepID=A0A453Q672_AEGTS